MLTLDWSVPGVPAPQGSFRPVTSRSTGKPMLKVNESGGFLRYRADVRSSAENLMTGLALWRGPVAAILVFVFPRPEGHWLPVNSRRAEPVLRPGAPRFHVGKPDADKLARSVLDALTGVVYLDDSQVCWLHASKDWSPTYGAGGHTAINLEEID